ncbi:recombinase family protein [Enterobacter kobei]
MKKLFIYHRVSTDKQAESGTGIERQEEDLQRFIESKNLLEGMDEPTPTVISDRGVSAFKGHNMTRGELGKWVDQVSRGMWDGSILVVESMDRFSRQNPLIVSRYLSTIVEQNVTIWDKALNIAINLDNSAMLPIIIMSAQRAYEESKVKSDRIRDGKKRKRETSLANGDIITSLRPKWIDVKGTKYVLNERAEIVREIFRLYQSGLGTPTIANVLNERGKEWQFDRVWRAEAVHKVLRNKRVTGEITLIETVRHHNDLKNPVTQTKRVMDVYPIVIEREVFDLVQATLKARRPGAGRTEVKDELDSDLVHPNILGGLCRCTKCGSAMYHNKIVANRKSKKNGDFKEEYRYIRCLNERDNLCDNKAVNYGIVEQRLIEHIVGLDFSTILTSTEVNPANELLKMKILKAKEVVQEYEEGIAEMEREGEMVGFKTMKALEKAEANLKELEDSYVDDEVQVDTSLFTQANMDDMLNASKLDIRGRLERELSKVISTIKIQREGKQYYCEIKYKQRPEIKHILVIDSRKKGGVNGFYAEQQEEYEVFYSTTFALFVQPGQMPQFKQLEKPVNQIDYTLLQNHLEYIHGYDSTVAWMRDSVKFVMMDH